ncbi:inorganic pyrophosphatase [Rhodovulum iodosum]|nr:inorganic pyrophosphatase [Rhodovulum robiginosum]
MPDRFWPFADAFVAGATVVIDRPRGSRHPRFPQIVYPLDYGYLDGTTAIDGDGVDLWRGSLAGARVEAVLASMDLTKRDAELKLLLGCTPAEMETIMAFHNQSEFMAAALLPRPAGI